MIVKELVIIIPVEAYTYTIDLKRAFFFLWGSKWWLVNVMDSLPDIKTLLAS
jgi:hypothetical protein